MIIDYDPEDILEPLNDKDDSGDDNDLDESGARDHYVSVGKSKLRNEQPLLDDPRYSGKRTSRKDIYSEDEEDIEEELNELSGSEVDEEVSDDSNDDDQDLLTDANSDEEEEEEESGEEEESDAEVAEEGDDEINTELRRIQEEEKYVYYTLLIYLYTYFILQTNDFTTIKECTI